MTTSNPSGEPGSTRTESFLCSYRAKGHFSKTSRISPIMRAPVLLLAEFPQFRTLRSRRGSPDSWKKKYSRNRYAARVPHVVRAYRLLSLTTHCRGRDKALATPKKECALDVTSDTRSLILDRISPNQLTAISRPSTILIS